MCLKSGSLAELEGLARAKISHHFHMHDFRPTTLNIFWLRWIYRRSHTHLIANSNTRLLVWLINHSSKFHAFSLISLSFSSKYLPTSIFRRKLPTDDKSSHTFFVLLREICCLVIIPPDPVATSNAKHVSYRMDTCPIKCISFQYSVAWTNGSKIYKSARSSLRPSRTFVAEWIRLYMINSSSERRKTWTYYPLPSLPENALLINSSCSDYKNPILNTGPLTWCTDLQSQLHILSTNTLDDLHKSEQLAVLIQFLRRYWKRP